MNKFIKSLYAILKALPIVIELVEIIAPKSKVTDNTNDFKYDKDIIDAV